MWVQCFSSPLSALLCEWEQVMWCFCIWLVNWDFDIFDCCTFILLLLSYTNAVQLKSHGNPSLLSQLETYGLCLCVLSSVFGVLFLTSQCVYYWYSSLKFHFPVLLFSSRLRRLRPKKRSILQGEILLLSNLLLSYKNKFRWLLHMWWWWCLCWHGKKLKDLMVVF